MRDPAWGERGWFCLRCRAALPPATACPSCDRAPLDLADPSARERVHYHVWRVHRPFVYAPYVSFRTPARALRGIRRWLRWTAKGLGRRAKLLVARPSGTTVGPHIPPAGVRGVVEREDLLEPAPFGGPPCVAYAVELRLSRGSVTLRDAASLGFSIALDDGRQVRIPPGPVVIDMKEAEREEAPLIAYLDWLRVAKEPIDLRPLVPYDEMWVTRIEPGDRVELRGDVREANDYRGLSMLTCVSSPRIVRVS